MTRDGRKAEFQCGAQTSHDNWAHSPRSVKRSLRPAHLFADLHIEGGKALRCVLVDPRGALAATVVDIALQELHFLQPFEWRWVGSGLQRDTTLVQLKLFFTPSASSSDCVSVPYWPHLCISRGRPLQHERVQSSPIHHHTSCPAASPAVLLDPAPAPWRRTFKAPPSRWLSSTCRAMAMSCSRTSLTMKIRSKRDKMVDCRSMFSWAVLRSSYLPYKMQVC